MRCISFPSRINSLYTDRVWLYHMHYSYTIILEASRLSSIPWVFNLWRNTLDVMVSTSNSSCALSLTASYMILWVISLSGYHSILTKSCNDNMISLDPWQNSSANVVLLVCNSLSAWNHSSLHTVGYSFSAYSIPVAFLLHYWHQ